jgi:hypothetical protein
MLIYLLQQFVYFILNVAAAFNKYYIGKGEKDER